jgi:ABC-type uncharacterized transport system auxiliary subunit
MTHAMRTLPSLIALVTLVACASGPAERDRFYRLEVPAPAEKRAKPVLPGDVEVDRPRADYLVRERKILHSEGAGSTEVTPYSYHFWVDSPTSMVQASMVRWLGASGSALRAVLPQDGVDEIWLVQGRLERFEHSPSTGEVIVVLELRLKDQRNGRLVLQNRYSTRLPAPADVPGAVPVFGQALEAIFEQFVADAASRK